MKHVNRGMEYGVHHKEITPLIKLDNLDIVEGVIVSDSIHCATADHQY